MAKPHYGAQTVITLQLINVPIDHDLTPSQNVQNIATIAAVIHPIHQTVHFHRTARSHPIVHFHPIVQGHPIHHGLQVMLTEKRE